MHALSGQRFADRARARARGLIVVVTALVLAGCTSAAQSKTKTTTGTHTHHRRSSRPPAEIGWTQRGMATWYGSHGGSTASGERMKPSAMTAAHRTLPFDTRVRVTHAKTGKSVVVRINDRGPYGRGRIIDLSPAAARKLGIVDEGVAPVVIEVVGQ
jgi:rare lipoprotein A (peptidoglycan hydrolase)